MQDFSLYPADGVAERYEARKTAYDLGQHGTPVSIPAGSRVRIDGPFGTFHGNEATVVSEIARQVVVVPDGGNGEQIVLGKAAVDIIE